MLRGSEVSAVARRSRLVMVGILVCAVLAGCTSGGSGGSGVGPTTPPTLTSVSPASGAEGTSVNVTLTGTNFGAGATVAVSGGGVSVSNLVVASSRSITATFAIGQGASPGMDSVTVTTSGGTSGAQTFVVLAGSGTEGTAYVVGDSALFVIDVATGTVSKTIGGHWVLGGVAITPDGTKAYVTDSDRDTSVSATASFAYDSTVSVIDLATGTVTKTITVGRDPRAIAITPDGSHACVANFYYGTASVIDVGTDRVTKTTYVGRFPGAIAITPDGTQAYVTDYVTGTPTVSVIDIATGTLIHTIGVGPYPDAIAITPDGRQAYVSDAEGIDANGGVGNMVSVIDVATHAVITNFQMPGIFSDPDLPNIAITADGTKAYVMPTGTDTVAVIDVATQTVSQFTIPALIPSSGLFSEGIAITPDGTQAYLITTPSFATVGPPSKEILVIDLKNERIIHEISLPVSEISGIAFH